MESRSRGRVVIESFESTVLAGNAAGDPALRHVPVYLPPYYDANPSRRYPVLYVLTGFMGRGRMLLNDSPWSPSLDDRMDDLIARGVCDEVILVMPDCFTASRAAMRANCANRSVRPICFSSKWHQAWT